MPQRHCFPFLGCRISGSPSLPWFFLDEGSREHRRRGRVANSPNREAAQRFTEFLADESADYAKASREYPVCGAGSDPVLQAWGCLNEDNVSAATLGRNNASALCLMEANGWSR